MSARIAFAALLLALCLPGSALANPELPAPLKSAAPGLLALGQGSMTWLGFSIYDATLWSAARPLDRKRPFALDIRYRREISGDQLVESTLDEMRRLGFGDEASRAQWKTALERIFPDVAPGDRLVGAWLPGRGVVFFRGGEAIGTVADERFAEAFFGIWLDPRTREPQLRAALLGEN